MKAFSLLLLLPLLAACHLPDPHMRDGSWRPTQANEQNLNFMVARPADLLRGTGETGALGHTAAQAIERLRTERVRSLPASGTAIISVTGSAGGS